MRMEKISFAQFKRDTKHKKVDYVWENKDKRIRKEFSTDRFYCNPFGKGNFKLLSMPRFNLSRENEFFKIDDSTYRAVSEHGETEFKVVA